MLKGTVVPALAALLTAGLASVTAWQLDRAAEEADTLALEADVAEIRRAVSGRVDTQVTLLRGVAGLLTVDPDVDAARFAAFVNRAVRERFAGMQGLGFAIRMRSPEEEPALARRAQAEDWHVWPPETTEAERHPILFLEPRDRRNLAALGYDMYAEPIRREAMVRARDEGRAVATSLVLLVQEIDPLKQAGFLIYAPVYEGGAAPDTVEERRARHLGYAYSPFRAGDFLESVFGPGGPGYDMDVYDGPRVDPEKRLYHFGDGGGEAPLLSSLDVVGRTWTLALAPHPPGAAARGPIIVLVGGLVTGGLLFLLMRGQARARDAAERSAEELRSSEARFRTVVEQSPNSMQFFDAEGRVTAVNPAFERIWGLTIADLADYRLFDDPQLEAEGLLPFLRKAFAGHPTILPRFGYAPQSGANKGKEIWVRAIAYPVRDEHGRIRQVVFTHEDVTEYHRAEEALLQAQKLESIGVLAGGIAHDFNNLLTGILGNASLAIRYLPADARPRRMIDEVIRAGERAAVLTRQLLAYAGKGRFVVKRLDLRDLVGDLADLLRTSLPKKVRLEVALSPDPAWVDVDAAQMQQLVMNLVINAGEAIGDDVGRVAVEVGHADVDAVEAADRWGAWNLAPGGYVTLAVRDTGAGMDPRTREQIFEPFFTTKFVGRGLGLSAALGIVRAHGGGIDVWSEPGQGSLFTVVLPRRAAPAEEAAPLPGREALRGTGTVLVVDDEPHVRDLAAVSLEEFGYDVLVAGDGPEAERVFRDRDDIRVVVLDMTMPTMGGEEVLRRLRAVRPRVRVVVSSGWTEEEARRRLAGQGIGVYLQKPWTVEQLAEAVQRATKTENAAV